jgi:hypothetical protein
MNRTRRAGRVRATPQRQRTRGHPSLAERCRSGASRCEVRLVEYLQRRFRRASLDDPIPEPLKRDLRERPHAGLVFDQQNRFLPTGDVVTAGAVADDPPAVSWADEIVNVVPRMGALSTSM